MKLSRVYLSGHGFRRCPRGPWWAKAERGPAAEDFMPSERLQIAGSAADRKAENAPGHSERPYFNQKGLKFNLFAVVVYFIGESENTLKTQKIGIKTKTKNQGNKKPPWWAALC